MPGRVVPYVVHLCLPEKKEIYITVVDANLTFALPVGGCNIVEIGKECNGDDFELVLRDLRANWNL